MFFKRAGLEVECGGGCCFVELKFIGALCAEKASLLRGRWWADYLLEGKDLNLYFGATHIVLSAYRRPRSEQDTLASIDHLTKILLGRGGRQVAEVAA